MGQARDRSTSKDDKDEKDEEKANEPEVVFEPAQAFVEAVQDDATAPDAPAPAPAPEPELSQDDDLTATLNRMAGELARLKATYGESVARITGERALTLMRRA